MPFLLTPAHRAIENCARSILYILAQQLELDERIPYHKFTKVIIEDLKINIYSEKYTLYKCLNPIWTYNIWNKASKKIILVLDRKRLFVFKSTTEIPSYEIYYKLVKKLYDEVPNKNDGILRVDYISKLQIKPTNQISHEEKLYIYERIYQASKEGVNLKKVKLSGNLKSFLIPCNLLVGKDDSFYAYVTSKSEIFVSLTPDVVKKVLNKRKDFVIPDEYITILS